MFNLLKGVPVPCTNDGVEVSWRVGPNSTKGEVHVSLVDTFDVLPGGRTVLDLAADWGDVAVFTALLRYRQGFTFDTTVDHQLFPSQSKGTALQVVDSTRRTILHRLCRKKKELPKLVEQLLFARVNVNDADCHGNTALDLAVANGHSSTVKLLLECVLVSPHTTTPVLTTLRGVADTRRMSVPLTTVARVLSTSLASLAGWALRGC